MKIFIVNAFAEERFGGNPAAVVPLRQWLPEQQMQQMSAQHNLAETAFIVPSGGDYEIRWFTPTVEVDLCGHATLASAHVLFHHLGYGKDRISFHSKSGPLIVSKQPEQKILLDFPADVPQPCDPVPEIEQGLKAKPLAVFRTSFDYMVVLGSQQTIEQLEPDFRIIGRLRSRGVIATAKGEHSDFVSRCFFPQSGIDEDPVTGSAHTAMVPYWAKELGKSHLSAIQLSKRRGYLDCEIAGDRVYMSGHAITYMEGDLL